MAWRGRGGHLYRPWPGRHAKAPPQVSGEGCVCVCVCVCVCGEGGGGGTLACGLHSRRGVGSHCLGAWIERGQGVYGVGVHGVSCHLPRLRHAVPESACGKYCSLCRPGGGGAALVTPASHIARYGVFGGEGQQSRLCRRVAMLEEGWRWG